jgi:hypothetical protein
MGSGIVVHRREITTLVVVREVEAVIALVCQPPRRGCKSVEGTSEICSFGEDRI